MQEEDQDKNHASNISVTKSDLASELERIKSATINAAEKRTHLPQPLFWSLFQSRINELKEAKQRARKLKEILGG